MDFRQTKDEFLVRYYSWALEDFNREIAEDFPFLRKFRGETPRKVLELMKALSESDRMFFAKSLVKRFHKRAVELIGEKMTSDEENFVENYLGSFTSPSDEAIETWNVGAPTPDRLKIDRKRLIAQIEDELKPILGERFEILGRDERRYSNEINGWKLRTWIDIGGRSHELSYVHMLGNPPSFNLNENISLFSWLGISSETKWRYLTSEDVSITAKTAAELCKHFFQAVPKLLDNLDFDENDPT